MHKDDPREIVRHNSEAWDRFVASGDRWTQPRAPEVIAAARRGDWSIVLTPTRPVPRAWFGELEGARVLGLAASGGQQAPVLAAAGAHVTVFDNSAAQLGQDRLVAERDGLDLRLEQGDMADLSRFDDASFDLVFHPVANCFVADLEPVWREVARVLRPGGRLLAGFLNPVRYMIGLEGEESGELLLRHPIPYADIDHLSPEQLEAHLAKDQPLEFGHSLEQQIGGQLEAGLVLTAMYEDADAAGHPVDRLMPTSIATLAMRPPLD